RDGNRDTFGACAADFRLVFEGSRKPTESGRPPLATFLVRLLPEGRNEGDLEPVRQVLECDVAHHGCPPRPARRSPGHPALPMSGRLRDGDNPSWGRTAAPVFGSMRARGVWVMAINFKTLAAASIVAIGTL